MTSGRECTLARTITLREYARTCLIEHAYGRELLADPDPSGRPANRMAPFRLFPGPGQGEIFLGPTHHVGVFPFRCTSTSCPEGGQHALVVLPKGTEADEHLGLLHFSQLLALLSDSAPATIAADQQGWRSGDSPGERFVLLLAACYSALVVDLCLHDFRRSYRREEGVLQGTVRGRIQVSAHLRQVCRGRAHRIPCRWEEFTPDNWDNRIVESAARGLARSATHFDVEGGARINALFRKAEPYFSLVEDVVAGPSDFARCTLDRVSTRYKRTLDWARQLIRGAKGISALGPASRLSLDSNSAFERLARKTIATALAGSSSYLPPKGVMGHLLMEEVPTYEPDIVIQSRTKNRVVAIGDAKYKRVLELCDGPGANAGNFESLAHAVLRLEGQPGASDLYQLYAYMRLSGSALGFFVVPFWKAGAQPADMGKPLRFTRSPLDRDAHELRVVGLNMMSPPAKALKEAARLVAKWLNGFA